MGHFIYVANYMKKYLLIAIIVLSATLISGWLIDYPMPPTKLAKSAREALHQAQISRADLFANTSFREASTLFDSAMVQWKRENEKFIWFRDYATMQNNLEQAISTANLSHHLAKQEKKQLGEKYAMQIADIKGMFADYERYYKNIPINQKDKNLLALAQLQLDECQLSIKNKKVTGVSEKLKRVKASIADINRKSEEIIKEYFEDYPKWEKLKSDAIRLSEKKKSSLIIVDKYQRQCLVYEKGVFKYLLPIELGSNWLGEKQKAGDKKTPEGVYQIIVKKEGNNTIYHKAFLLDYPNTDDLKRFKRNIRDGVITKNSTIGGAIEIHGVGGKGADWTDGCVALVNQDMDKLYKNMEVGTPVVIVGSTKPLHELIKL